MPASVLLDRSEFVLLGHSEFGQMMITESCLQQSKKIPVQVVAETRNTVRKTKRSNCARTPLPGEEENTTGNNAKKVRLELDEQFESFKEILICDICF